MRPNTLEYLSVKFHLLFISINMKYILLVLFTLFLSQDFIAQEAIKETLIASCCNGNDGRCTGSSSCRVCTNCSRCGHCNSGGSCGVCSRSTRVSAPKYHSKPNNSSRGLKTSSPFYLPDDPSSPYYLKILLVNTENLNLRKGSGASYPILSSLQKNQKLIFLAITGDWVKVRTKEDSITGFVFYKYVVVLDN